MLPPLRQELILHPGPATSHGAPTWSLQDPVRNLFFHIDWLTYELLSRWSLDDPGAILAAMARETTLHAEEEDILAILRFLGDNELIQRPHREGSAWFLQQQTRRRPVWWRWLLHHYLFFRIPLWRPDHWLERLQPWVAPFHTRAFLLLTLTALGVGLLEVSRQWDLFVSTLVDAFSWWGLLDAAMVLVVIKLLHELGHAMTAKRYGCRVPVMGIAFLVMFPMAYTDVNEAWKLRERRQRLAVGAAGMVTELVVAAWATLAWSLLPDGHWRDSAFLLATTTWVSTLVINTSPFMRFDGYFLLMDWLEMPNLHARAFALARWWLRERLFGLGEEPPEYLPPRRLQGLIAFAVAVWLYRLAVFISIAIMVYLWFPKPLGPFLAAVEVGWFIALPLVRELSAWHVRQGAILRSRRSWLTVILVGLGLALAILPWDRRIHGQGVLQPVQHLPILSPGPSRLLSLPVEDGAHIPSGGVLAVLEPAALAFQQRGVEARLSGLRWQAATAGVDTALGERRLIIQEELHQASVEVAALEAEVRRYTPIAPFAGQFHVADPELHPGVWVGRNAPLGTLADTSRWVVESYLPESALDRIQPGDQGWFFSETPGVLRLPLVVEFIDHDAVHSLSDGMLAATRGGALLVRDDGERLVPEDALYRIRLSVMVPMGTRKPLIVRGEVLLFGNAKGYLEDFTRSAMALLVRELGP